MMVLRETGVECSAKIAMTALRDGAATMRLLPKPDRARSHFSRRARRAAFLIVKMATETDLQEMA